MNEIYENFCWFVNDEFLNRLHRYTGSLLFYEGWAEAAFKRDCYWMFYCMMSNSGLDEEAAFEMMKRDKRTLDKLFEEAMMEAKFE